jgi:hypothetical protein
MLPKHAPAALALAQVPRLLRGEAMPIRLWLQRSEASRTAFYVLITSLGAAAFGAAVGSWRDPLQALYTGLKFPLILLLTAFGNGLLNGMVAPLLGINVTFRQSLFAVLMSFTIAGVVLGACSPLVWFLVWNSPGFVAQTDPATAMMHSVIFIALVAALAGAGVAGNLRLMQLLLELSGSRAAARRTMLAWLAGNLLLGSQLAWLLRPFVGAPHLPVQFLRPDAFHGNFFEALINHARQLFS